MTWGIIGSDVEEEATEPQFFDAEESFQVITTKRPMTGQSCSCRRVIVYCQHACFMLTACLFSCIVSSEIQPVPS
jgi:hypothetical protein